VDEIVTIVDQELGHDVRIGEVVLLNESKRGQHGDAPLPN
jgi:hypothetical protein